MYNRHVVIVREYVQQDEFRITNDAQQWEYDLSMYVSDIIATILKLGLLPFISKNFARELILA